MFFVAFTDKLRLLFEEQCSTVHDELILELMTYGEALQVKITKGTKGECNPQTTSTYVLKYNTLEESISD